MNTGITSASVDTARAVESEVSTRLDGYLELVTTLAGIDSGPDSPAGTARVAEILGTRLEDQGADLLWEKEGDTVHLHARLSGGAARVLILGHSDTVFPSGTGRERPASLRGNRLVGPGVADMKGGLVAGLAAIEAMAGLDGLRPTVDFVVVGDEEIRLTPPPVIESIPADACLVLECGRPGNGFVVGRKAGMWVDLSAQGRAAHVGTERNFGSNAILALCNEMLRIADLDGSRRGLSVTVGHITGGSVRNAVPDLAQASLDLRTPDRDDLDWAFARIAEHREYPGVRLEVRLEGAWPPMRRDHDDGRLAGVYKGLGRSVGHAVKEETTGGMSDGCWTSDAGTPTIDGLGPVGGGDHGPDEYIEIDSFAPRAGLLAGMLSEIEERKREGG